MWLLPSIGRPQACQEVLDACEAMGMTAKGVVFVDGPTTLENDRAYRALRLPTNWALYFAPERKRLAYQMNWVLEQWPNESAYGWIADDMLPRTPGFDRQLEEAAGTFGYAQCNDGLRDIWPAGKPGWPGVLTAGLCWGGDLVRAAGWWAYPTIVHAAIDGIWALILREMPGAVTYLPDVLIQHYSWRIDPAHPNYRSRDAFDCGYQEYFDQVMGDDYEFYKDFRRQKSHKRQAQKLLQKRAAWQRAQAKAAV